MKIDKRKIGIITYHTAINYGAVLQAYALNKKIRLLGGTCETIDYQCPGINRQYEYRSWKDSFSWKNFFAQNITSFLHSKKKKNFVKFRKSIVLSEKCDRDNISNVSKKYDIFITGSDQVFNPVCNQSDPTYFLDFVTEGSKNSYAASLGSIRQFKTSKIDTLGYLSGFDNLSFREEDASKHISEELERDCLTVMDPVWLLQKDEWEKVAETKNEKPYIFVYNLMDYGYMRKFVIALKKKTGLPVISVSRTIMGDALYFGISKNQSNCSPNEFLGYIKDAKYIVTDSFHGTSFSVLFEKDFFVALNPSANNTNSRMDTVLDLTGLKARAIDPIHMDIDESTIDYIGVKKRLEMPIKKSIEYIKEVCLLK